MESGEERKKRKKKGRKKRLLPGDRETKTKLGEKENRGWETGHGHIAGRSVSKSDRQDTVTATLMGGS